MSAGRSLSGGLGNVPLFIEIRRQSDDELIRISSEYIVRFNDRIVPMSISISLNEVQFEDSDVYVVSLFCHNTWVCDTTLTLT